MILSFINYMTCSPQAHAVILWGKLINRLVDRHLKSQEVKDLLKESINKTLQPAIAGLSGEIGRNIERLVMEIKQPFRDVDRFQKDSIDKLHRFLRSSEARSLKSKGFPIALTMTVRQGERYAQWAIQEYLSELTRKFGKQFRYVLILDNDGKFLALFPPRLVYNQDPNRLMRLLNSGPQLRTTEATKELERMFSRHSTVFIQSEWSIKQALTIPVWSTPYRPDEEVAVVDRQKIFRGTTTRQLLIEGILS
jgi:hypothetical protein